MWLGGIRVRRGGKQVVRFLLDESATPIQVPGGVLPMSRQVLVPTPTRLLASLPVGSAAGSQYSLSQGGARTETCGELPCPTFGLMTAREPQGSVLAGAVVGAGYTGTPPTLVACENCMITFCPDWLSKTRTSPAVRPVLAATVPSSVAEIVPELLTSTKPLITKVTKPRMALCAKPSASMFWGVKAGGFWAKMNPANMVPEL